MPQHNSLAELASPYLAGEARAIMGGAKVLDGVCYKVALEVTSVLCVMYTCLVRTLDGLGTSKSGVKPESLP